jgi:polyisoprenyl-teichoic acid--peptidoglycan teichoic acid transferase
MDLGGEGAGRSRSPSIASFLSFLWPGLGQWYLRRTRAALLYALPVVVVVVAVAVRALASVESLALDMIDPSVALTVLVLIVLLAGWRLSSMVDAGGGVRAFRGRAGAPHAVLFVALALIVVLTHAAAGYYAWSFYDAGSHIFVADVQPDSTPAPAASADDFEATPLATPATKTSRINILLTGIDSSEQRTHALTDTLIVVSIDPVTNKVAMLSFPRDIARFPMWNGKTFSGKINSLMTYANQHPAEYPDGGLPTLIRETGFLLGVPIHYYAAVNLEGFEQMIDQVGGVTIVNDRAIDDPGYGGWHDGRVGFTLSAGPHKLDGETALAYVRSRKGAGDNDFTRARRQQQLLVALRKKLTEPAMIAKLPGLLQAAGRTIKTNFPPDRLSEMLGLGRGTADEDIAKYVLGPPYATHPPNDTTGGTYILKIDFDRLAALSVKLFGQDSSYAKSSASGSTPSAAP